MMKHDTNGTRSVSTPGDKRTMSQAIFIAVGLLIIIGGLWVIYQGNAPYHPQVSIEDAPLYLANDG